MTQQGPEDNMTIAYQTEKGRLLKGYSENILPLLRRDWSGKIDLIITSPPFPLNRKKKYGNLQGPEYIDWLAEFAPVFKSLVKPTGSIVIEVGNAWEPGRPVMSTLSLKALLAFQERADLQLCQQFVIYNPARLPSPAQWVNVERIRVKDAYTHVWWLSPSDRPKADNRRVAKEYSPAMLKLLETRKYNAGPRPSEHHIGKDSFLTNNGGAIPPNVITMANTGAGDQYQRYCKRHAINPHPARMRTDLVSWFIRFLTDPGDMVVDPFAGSNTTGYVAESMGRRWIAIEPEQEYIDGSRGRFWPDE